MKQKMNLMIIGRMKFIFFYFHLKENRIMVNGSRSTSNIRNLLAEMIEKLYSKNTTTAFNIII